MLLLWLCVYVRYVLVSCLDEDTSRTSITVYDLRNKYVGMNSTLPALERVRLVLQDGDTAYVLTSKGSLIRCVSVVLLVSGVCVWLASVVKCR